MITSIQLFKEAMNKQSKDNEIFDYMSITNDLWRKIIHEAQEFQNIKFDLENNESLDDKRILTIEKNLRKDQPVKVKIACELCEAGGDWEASCLYFKIEFINQYGTISNKYYNNPEFVWDQKQNVDTRKFVLIPPFENGNHNLLCDENGCGMKGAEEYIKHDNKNIKLAWEWLEKTLTDAVNNRWEMLDEDDTDTEKTPLEPANGQEPVTETIYKNTVYNQKECPNCKSINRSFIAPMDYKRLENGDYKRVVLYECNDCKTKFESIK